MSYNYNVLQNLWKVRTKTREEDDALGAVPIRQGQSFSFQLLFAAAMFMLFGATSTFAQTTIINPNGDGGFENGATFQANGWTPVNDDVDQWYVGNVQAPASGANGAYISSTNGKSHVYSIVSPAQVSFFYRDVTVPAGEDKITLSFKWKNVGQNSGTGDKIGVYVAPTTLTPIASQLPPGAVELSLITTTGATAPGIGLTLNPEYKTETYLVPKSYAGTTFRLIFAYKVAVTGNNGFMPGAIDNISLVSQVPSTVKSIKSGNWSDATIWDSGAVPQNENVVIDTGHTVKIDKIGDIPTTSTTFDILTGSASTNNLTVNGTLTFGEVAGSTIRMGAGLQIYGNLVVNAGGNFNMYYNGILSVPSTTKTYTTFTVGGDVTNNGQMDIFGSEMILWSSNVQTMGGTGQFTNSNSLTPTYTSTMYVNNMRLRNSNSATPNVICDFDAKVANILEMRQARVNLGSKVLTLGSAQSASNTFPVTEDAGFTSGSKFVRFWTATNFGFTIPTAPNVDFSTSGSNNWKYPFVSSKGENRSVYVQRLNIGSTIPGEIGMVYNDASTYTTGLSIADGASTITNRYDGNWVVTDGTAIGSGVTNNTYRIAITAPGVLNTAPALANNAVRIMGANSAFGTFLPGNKVPTAIRELTSAQLTAGPLYLGAAASDLIPATTVTSVASGNWNSPATWSNSQVPANTDVVTIADGTTVTVNSAGNVCKNVTIAAGGTLLNVSGDLTVGTLNNSVFINNGTLNVSGGTLKINGSSVHNSLSTFIQSGGNIIVDGSDGTIANSVATGVPMMKIIATKPANLQWTGGTLTFVDPHVGSASITGGNPEYVLTVNQYGDYNSASRNHTVKFGDGASTTPAGTPEGFRFHLKPDNNGTTAPFRLGSVVVDTGNDNTYRMVKPNAAGGLHVGFEGDVTITSGILVFPSSGTNYMINGNLVNNGTLINAGTLYMGMQKAYYNQTGQNGTGVLTAYEAPCPNPQSISGTGKFLCTLLAPVAEIAGLNTTANLTINNSSASGVTLNVPLTVVSNGTQGTFTLMQGILNTTNTNLLTLGTIAAATAVNTTWLGNSDTYVNGPLARYFANGSTSTNYIFFPVGKSKFLPFSIAPTTPSAPVFPYTLVKVEAFESNEGTADATCSNLASVRWETTSSVPFGISNVKLGDANIAAGMIPVQSTSASGVYTAAFGNTSTFTTTAPNTIQSGVAAVATNYFSYGKLAACTGTPVAGLASIPGSVNGNVTVGYNGPIELSLQNSIMYEGQTYQWEGSADNVTYTPIDGLTTALAYTKQNDAISYYRCRVTCGGTTAVSSFAAVTVVPNTTWASSGSSSGTALISSPVCPGSSAFINNVGAFNAGTSYCALYDSPEGSGTAPIYFNTTNNVLPTGPLTATKTFYVAVIEKSTGKSSKRVPVTVEVSAVPEAPTAVAQTFCNSTPTDATVANLVTTSGTGIKWYDAPAGGNPLVSTAALASGTYYASQTFAGCESTSRTPVVTTVIGAPTATAQSVCNSGTVANLVATGLPGSTIKWYSASANGIQWTSTDPLVAGNYFASQTVGGCETKRTMVAVSIGTAVPAAPTGTATQSFCVTAAKTLADIVTSPNTGIKWYDAAAGGNLIPSTTVIPAGSNDYYASQTVAGCESGARLKVTATVNVVDAPIATSPQTLCGAAGLITNIVASPNPSTATATYKYYNVATGGTAITTGSPVNGTTYYVSQVINSCEGIARTPVLLNYSNPSPPIGVSPTFCGTPAPKVADLTPLVTTSLPGSTIKWYESGTLKSPTDLLVTAKQYSAAEVTASGCESAARTNCFVTIGSTTLPAAPTVLPAESFATGATVANLYALGGAVKWYDAATGGTPLDSTTPLVDGASYFATQTTTGCESPRAQVVATLGATLPGAPSANSPQMVCSGASATVAALVATGDPGSTIKWYSTPTGGQSLALLTTASLNTTTYYYASQTVNGAESILRTPVLVYVNSSSNVPPTAPAVQSFCSSTATVADLTANGTGIKWYTAASGAGVALAPTAPLTTGVYYPTQTYNGCETGTSAIRNAVNVVVSATPPAAPTVVAPQSVTPTVCYGSTVGNLSVTGLAGSIIKWYDDPVAGSLLPSTTPLVTGTTYYASQTVGCEGTARLAVTPTVKSSIASPTAAATQAICTSAIANLQASGAPGNTIKWYTSATGSVAAPSTLVNSTYYAADSDGTCESVRIPVAVSVVPVAAPTAIATQNFCSSSASVANLVANGPGIKWYNAATGGTPIDPATALISGNKYYPTQTNGMCETPSATTRTAVTVTVTPTVTAPAPAAAQTVCFATGTPATMAALTPQPNTTTLWYNSPVGGTALSSGQLLTSGTYYAATLTAGCESARVASIVSVYAKPAAPVVSSITQPSCTLATASVVLSGLPAGTWTINTTPETTGTGNSTTISGMTTGTKSFTVKDSNNCTSVGVTVNVSTQPTTPVPTAAITQPTCAVTTGSLTLGNLPVGVWILNPGNIVSSGTTKTLSGLAIGSYTYTLTNAGGCISAPIPVVITRQPVVGTITQPTCALGGKVELSGLPATGNWIINPGAIAGSGSTYTVTDLAPGNYNFTVTDAVDPTCITPASATVTINPQPATPAVPALGAVTQPTCSVATGSFVITNYDASYTYAFNPSANVVRNAGTVTAPAGTYTVTATLGACTSAASANATVDAQPTTLAQPTFGTVTQPTCSVATGSFAIANYDASYTYAFTPSAGVVRNAGTVTAPAGTYTVTATLGACTSAASENATVNDQPTTLAQPTFGTVTQPTCTVATGSFAIANYDASYAYAFTPSAGVVRNAGTVTAPAGTYTVAATLGACTSAVSASATVNPQPATPAVPTLGAVTQPTCSTATGSFAISNYDAAYTYAFTPPTGVVENAGAVTAPAGTYTVTATLGACTSAASANATVNAQPVTPTAPVVGTITQPTAESAGSVVLSGLPSGNWTIAQSGTASNTITGAAASTTVSGLNQGTYTFTVSNGTCTSVATANVVINAPVIPAPTGVSPQTFNKNVTASDLVVNVVSGGTVTWYASQSDATLNINPLAANAPLDPGKTYYAVQTVNGHRSTSVLAVEVAVTLAVDQFEAVRINFYPNPVIDMLNITHTGVMSSIEVYNLLGQRVRAARPNAASTKVDMSDLPVGTYLLEVQSEGKTATLKVIKNQ